MVKSTTLKYISIYVYLAIFLKGSIIGLPLGLYLILALFNYETIAPLFAAMALAGIIMIVILNVQQKSKLNFALEVIPFFLLLSPILYRLFSAPLYMFHYWMFTIPLACFVGIYIVSSLFSYRELRQGSDLFKFL